MLIRGAVALLLLLVALAARAQPPATRIETYPAHAVTFPGQVTGIPDVVYASYLGYRPLLLDLYLPSARDKPSPLVVYVHGGGMRAADSRSAIGIEDFPAALASLAARGYAVASVNYRLSSEARFPAQVQDVKAAIVYLRANAAKYNIDPARALLWGASSGGQLAALAAMTCGKPAFAPPPSNSRPILREVAAARDAQVSDCVQGALIWYGDLDLTKEPPDPAINAFLGCDPCDAAQLLAASPISFASPATPLMLLVQGTEDPIPLAVPQAMAARLKELGVPVETLYLPDVGHGFIGKTPEITRKANDQALQRTFGYIDGLFSERR